MVDKRNAKFGKFFKKIWPYRFLFILAFGIIIFAFLERSSIHAVINPQRIGLPEAFYNISERKPLPSDYYISQEEDSSLIDDTLKKIFPNGHQVLTDEEKTIEIARYVSVNFISKDNAGTATKIIKDGYGICGAKSIVFRVLTRRINVPSRYVGIYYSTYQGGHDLVEVYYKNSWHLFDPTFAVFIYSNPLYDNMGNILSMAELRKNPKAGFMQT